MRRRSWPRLRSNDSNPDSDGTTVVYDSERPSATGQDVYFKPVAGGTETALELPGLQRNPAISAGVISFESKDTPETPADLFAYVIATNTVFRVTNTPAVDETLNDVSVLPSGAIRVVWAANDDVEPGLHNVYARTFTLPSSNPPPPAEPGDILVVDPDVPPVSTAVLFQVDPQTGARTVLSNFGGSSPNAVAVEASGNILVTDTDAGTDPAGGTSEWGALYRISRDPVTGDLVRTIVADFGVGANTGRNPRAVAVEADGHILVLNGNGGTADRAAARPPRPDHRHPSDRERLRKQQPGRPRRRAQRGRRRGERADPRRSTHRRARSDRASSSGSTPRPGSASP